MKNFMGCGDKFLFKGGILTGWAVNFGVEYTIMLEHVDPFKMYFKGLLAKLKFED